MPTTEKKTYLIDIKDNLDEYARRAAEAGKEVDKLTQENKELKASGKASATEIEKHNAKLNAAKKVYRDAKKEVETLQTALKSETGSRKQLGEILKLQQRELGKLGNAYIKDAQGIRRLNPLYIDQRKKIEQTKSAIIKYDQAIKDGRSNVGRYSQSIKDMAKQMFLAGGVIGTAIMVFRKIFDVIRKGTKDVRAFEDEFSNVLTLLTEAQKLQFKDILQKGSIELMAEYGFTVEETNKALFDYISATGDAAGAIDFLNESAKVAIGGSSTLSAVVDGATNIMGAYGDKAGSTTEILNSFFAAQVKGKTTVELLAESVGKVASVAASADIPISELMATFASSTKFVGGTEESATALANVINALIKPSVQAKQTFSDLGIETGITAVKQDGLLNKLLEVAAAYEGNNDVLTELIPNIRAFRGIAGLSSEAIREIEKNITDLNDTQLSSLLVQDAFNEKMATGERKSKIAAGSWKALMIEIGGGESIFKKIGNDIRDSWIASLDSATKKLQLFKITIQRLLDTFRKEENKRADDLIKEYAGVNDKIIEDEKITTIELTEEEKLRQALLENIRKKAAARRTKEERETAAAAAIEQAARDLQIAKDNATIEIERFKALVNEKKDYEIKIANERGEETLGIRKRYAAAEAEIDKLTIDTKLALATGFAANIATIFGENTAIGKAAAVAETTINTYASATAAYKALASVPLVGPVLGAAAAAAAIAAGIANVKKILAVKSGLPGDTGGGVMPTAIIKTPTAQRAFAPPAGSTILTQPQLTQTQLNTLPQQNLLTADAIAEALKRMPAPVVTVEDINAKIANVKKVEVRATI